MNINWKVRARNPVFWVQILCAAVLPILTYLGLSWEDMTSWAALGEIFVKAAKPCDPGEHGRIHLERHQRPHHPGPLRQPPGHGLRSAEMING